MPFLRSECNSILNRRRCKASRRRQVLERLEQRLLLSANNQPALVNPISDLEVQDATQFIFKIQTAGIVAFGFEAGGVNIEATDNYFSSALQFLKPWQEVTFTGNTIANAAPYRSVELFPYGASEFSFDEYRWDNNVYVTDASIPFNVNRSLKTYEQWQNDTGFDSASTITSQHSGTEVSVRANQYEPGRGHAVVYNWDGLDEVALDLSGVVDVGANYQIYHVSNLKGDSVRSGVFDGTSVTVPMVDTPSPTPIGYVPVVPVVNHKEFATFLILSDAEPIPASGNEFYVAADAAPDGDGTLASPWDVQTVMQHPASIQPGDTIWFRGGTYRGGFTSDLEGTALAPIDVREMPGEHVIFDLNNGTPLLSPNIAINGRHTRFQGFEVFSSNPSSRWTPDRGSWPDDIQRGNITVFGDHVKLINWEIHDINGGLGYWSAAEGGEVYGSLIYNNGWIGGDRGHGHGIYSQNGDAERRFTDNVIFNQFRNGINIYGTSAASLKNHTLEGNVIFNSGAARGEGYSGSYDILIGGGAIAENMSLHENFTYTRTEHFRDTDFGDTVTYSARQADGSPLPSWLTFYGSEGLFIGTPGLGDVKTITIELTATDSFGASATDTFNLTVRPKNLAPTLVSSIGTATVSSDRPFELDLSDHFSDPESGSLTYSIAPASGIHWLPWISIDSNGRISGMQGEPGVYEFQVFAYDEMGAFTSDSLTLEVGAAPVGTDLSIEILNNFEVTPVENDIVYSLRVTNHGLNTASDVVVSQILPPQSTLVSSSTSCESEGDVVTCSLGNVIAGATVSLTIVIATTELGPTSSTFSVAAHEHDPNQRNNTISDTHYVNAVPVAANDAVSIDENSVIGAHGNLIDNDNDLNTDETLSIQKMAQSDVPGTVAGDLGFLTWDANGNFTYVLNTDDLTVNRLAIGQSLSDVFQYIVVDEHGGSAVASLNVTVSGMNDPPTLVHPIADIVVFEDENLNLDLAQRFADIDNLDALTLSLSLVGGALLPDWLRFDQLNQTLTGTPLLDDVGTISILVTATDAHGDSVTDTFALSVDASPRADLRVEFSDTVETVLKGDQIVYSLLVRNDGPDTATDVVVVQLLPAPSVLVSSSAACTEADGTLWCSVGDLDSGTSTEFTVTITTTQLGWIHSVASIASGVIDSNELNNNDSDSRLVNAAPIVTDDAVSISEDATIGVSVHLLDNDSDLNSEDSITVTQVGSSTTAGTIAGEFGGLTWNEQGDATYVLQFGNPSINQLAVGQSLHDVFSYTVIDDHGASSQGSLMVTINGANDSPTLRSQILDASVQEDESIHVDLAGHFEDVDQADDVSLAVTLSDGSPLPLWLSFDGFSGELSGTPSNRDVGVYEIEVTATDLLGATVSAEFKLTVAERALAYVGSGNLLLKLDAGGNVIQLIRSGAVVTSRELLQTQFIEIEGVLGSQDSLTIDFANGNPIPEGGVTWNGGGISETDSLAIIGGAFDALTVSYWGDSGHGNIEMTDAVSVANIHFAGTNSLSSTIVAENVSFQLSDEDDLVSLSTSSYGRLALKGDTLVDTTFLNPTKSLTISGNAGADQVRTSNALTFRGTNLIFDAESVLLTQRLSTQGGDIHSRGEEFVSTGSAMIFTGGGSIDLNHKEVRFGASVFSRGGQLVSHGTGAFTTLSYAARIDTSGGSSEGMVNVDHLGDVTLYAVRTGGAELEVSSGGNVRYRGTIDLRGSGGGHFYSSGVEFLLDDGSSVYTTGGDIVLEHSGTVTLGEGVSTVGGDFRSTGPGDFIARDAGASIQTYGSQGGIVDIEQAGKVTLFGILTGGGSVKIDSDSDVRIRGRVNTSGSAFGAFLSTGKAFSSDLGVTITTLGGDVLFDHVGAVTIGGTIRTNGGVLRSTGNGDFSTASSAAAIFTSGASRYGDVVLHQHGDIDLQQVWTGGGDLVLNAGGDVHLRGLVDLRGVDGGRFTSSGNEFRTDFWARVLTGGGDIELQHQGAVTIDTTIQTGGGDFSSAGDSTFTATAGARIYTYGGTVNFDHQQTVLLLGTVFSFGGPWGLTLNLHPDVTGPRLDVRGAFDVPRESVLTVDLNGHALAEISTHTSPVVIAGTIAFASMTGDTPSVTNLVNVNANDPPLVATLAAGSGNQLDLVLSPQANSNLQGALPAESQSLVSRYNSNLAADVNHDGLVSARDALIVINHLSISSKTSAESLVGAGRMSLDVNGDGTVTVVDSLIVINAISRQRISAEGAWTATTKSVDQAFLEWQNDEDWTGSNQNQLTTDLLGGDASHAG